MTPKGLWILIDTHIRAMGTVIPRIFQAAATAEVASLAGQVHATVGLSFDPGSPRAAALMRANQMEFVTAMSESQRAATREAMAMALEQGLGARATTRAFRDSIGLADTQVRAVANYRALLEANSARALDRALRDKRFDPTVEGAIETGEPLRPDQIDRMVERYEARMRDFRAETIARTETIKTSVRVPAGGVRTDDGDRGCPSRQRRTDLARDDR